MNTNYECDNLAECTCGCGPWCRLKGQFDDNCNYIEFDCKDCKDFVKDPNPEWDDEILISPDDPLDPDEEDEFFKGE
jgi:hypothetical protein